MAFNMLQLPFRQSHDVSLSAAMKEYISAKYDQRPDMFEEDLIIIDRLRSDAINVQEPHPSGKTKLFAYAAQLQWISSKFPIDVGVDFSCTLRVDMLIYAIWFENLLVSQNNLRFELANVLFNLAALYSQLALSISHSSPDNLRTACQHLCRAAGVLSHLRTEILPNLRSSPPEDMDEMTLLSLQELLLGQAQEFIWQKAVQDKLKDASIARLAAQVSDFYANAGGHAIKSDVIGTDWIHHMTAKHHHFAAAAQYRQSLDCLERRKYGEEVARLRDSMACTVEALKEKKWINKGVVVDLHGLEARVSQSLKRAEKDNDKIYLQTVPEKSELKILVRAPMVAANTPVEVLNPLSMIGDKAPLGKPLLEKLVPYSVHVAARIYTDRRNRRVKETVDELETLTQQLRELLSSLNLPGSLQALEKPLGLPPTLVSHAEEIRQQDGLNRLYRSLDDTSKLKTNDKAIYSEAVELLMAEKDEDDSARMRYGTQRWSRLPSEKAATKLYTQATEIERYLSDANNSDSIVQRKLAEHETVLCVLTGTNKDLEAFVPSSRRPVLSAQVERETTRLRSSLNEVARLENRRKYIIEALHEKAKTDNIDPALLKETARLEREYPMQMIEAGQFEDLFEQHLRKYDSDRDMLSGEQKKQVQLTEQLREANKAFTAARRGDSSTKEREKALQKLENGYIKYKEIISNSDVGRKFYNDLAKIVRRFQDDTKKFVNQRRIEASQMETDITNTEAMSTMNLSRPPQLQQQFKHHQPSSAHTSSFVPHQPSAQFASPPELIEPQPTRANVVPPPSTMPAPATPQNTGGVWSPDMGIRFGGAIQPSTNVASPFAEGRPTPNSASSATGASAAPRQPAQWDPSRGLRFS
ncbi:pH-response regulator protein palA/rim20 [Myotisia sp. PD_48]|nr:pH-response regulator protein palA/rim20 [Myotisia sp. PD_48]